MKRALVLSGGGSKGAFEVGAIDYLVNQAKFDFKVFLGTSVGALNAALLGQARNYQELAAYTHKLKELWQDIKGDQSIYTKSILSVLELLLRGSLYRPTGLIRLLKQYVNLDNLCNPASVVKVTAVALETGELLYADSRNPVLKNDYLKYVLASASMPIFFPPVQIAKKHWYDGGLRDITPLGAVFEENPDEIVVIITFPIGPDLNPIVPKAEYKGAIKALLRLMNISGNEIAANDLQLANAINLRNWIIPGKKLVPIRIIAPPMPLSGKGVLDFIPGEIRNNMKLGYIAARNPMILKPGIRSRLPGIG